MKVILTTLMFATSVAYAQTAPVIVAQPSTTPYTVFTSSGSYLVVPNYSTGQPSAVIQVGTTSSGNTTTTNTGGSRR